MSTTVADTRNEKILENSTIPDPKEVIFLTFGSSPLRQRRDRVHVFGKHPDDTKNWTNLQVTSKKIYVAFNEISGFICLPLPFWGFANRDGSGHFNRFGSCRDLSS